MCHKRVEKAEPGDIVALNVKGLEHTNAPRAGDVMVLQRDTELTATKKFDAQLYVLALSDEIRVGTSLTCLMRCGRAPGKVSAIKWKIAPGEGRTENPESIQGRGAACCSIELDTALVCDTSNLGRSGKQVLRLDCGIRKKKSIYRFGAGFRSSQGTCANQLQELLSWPTVSR